MPTYYFVVLIFVITNSGATSEYEEYHLKSSGHPHSRIKDVVLIDYDPTIRPITNHQNATTVAVRMVLKSIDYNAFTNTLDVHTWLPMYWIDDHLKWNKKDYDNVDTIFLHSSEIWTPDLSIYNAQDQSEDPAVLSGVTCSVSNLGVVTCVPPMKSSAYCRAKLRWYPYDKQNCSISFGSWVYSGEEVNFTFQTGAVLMDDYGRNAEWELLNVSVVKNVGRYKCCPNNTYPSLIYTFFLKRHPGFHAATVVVPALVIMITTLLTFCLDPAGMDRFCLACVNVIIHLLHLQFVSWSLPNFGDEVPLIIDYGRNSLMLSAFALILTAVLKQLVYKPEDSPMWISNTITSFLGSRAGQIILLFNYSLKSAAAVKGEEDGTNIIENRENNKDRDCTLFAKILDRLCLLIFFIVYFCMFITFIPEQ